MRRVRYISVKPRSRNPLIQALVFVAGLGVVIASVILGAFLLAAMLGFALIMGIVLFARLWWLRRQMQGRRERDDVIDTEYTVVDSRKRDSRRR